MIKKLGMKMKLLILSILMKSVMCEDKYRVVATALYYTSSNGKVLLATGSLPIDTEKTIVNDIQERFGNDLPISVVPVYKSVHDVPTRQYVFTSLRRQFPTVYVADIPQSKSRQIIHDMRKYTAPNPLLMYMKSQMQPMLLKTQAVNHSEPEKQPSFDLRDYLLLARNMNLSSVTGLSGPNDTIIGIIPSNVRQGEMGSSGDNGSKQAGGKGPGESAVKGPREGGEKTPGAGDDKGLGEGDKKSAGAEGGKDATGGTGESSGAGKEPGKIEPLQDNTPKTTTISPGRAPSTPPPITIDEIVPNDIYYAIELTCANWNNICDDRAPKKLRHVPAKYLGMPMIDIKIPRHELSP